MGKGRFVLYESAAGYALFNIVESGDDVGIMLSTVQSSVLDLGLFSKMCKLESFLPFTSAADALQNINDVSEGILNDQLAKHPYILGDTYTIVDMAAWGWARLMPRILSDEAFDDFPHLKRLVDEITLRPAGQGAVKLAAQHKFKTEMDAESYRYMFPGNSPVAD